MEDIEKIRSLGDLSETRPVNLPLVYQRALDIYRDVLGGGGINVFQRELIPFYHELYANRNAAGIVNCLQQIMEGIAFSSIRADGRPQYLREVVDREKLFEMRRAAIRVDIIRKFAFAQAKSIEAFGRGKAIIATALYGSWGRNAATWFSDADFFTLAAGNDVDTDRDLKFSKDIYFGLLDNAKKYGLYMLLHEQGILPNTFELEYKGGVPGIYEACRRMSVSPVFDFTIITPYQGVIGLLPEILHASDPSATIEPIVKLNGVHASYVQLPGLAREI